MFDIRKYGRVYPFKFHNIETDIENNKKYISNVTEEIYHTGYPCNSYWTFEFIDIISKYINFDDVKTIFDVGSRDCYQSIEFSTWFKNSEIYAFEANPEAYNTCLNVSNSYNNINVVGKGVGEKNCKLDFYISDGNPGSSSLLVVEQKNIPEWGRQVRSHVVDVVRIDDWCESNKINFPDILWVDVQGYENEVFRGCEGVLDNVKAIQTEISFGENDYVNGTEFHSLHSYLESKNFELVGAIFHECWNGIGEIDVVYVNKRFKI